jgi:hypothetical protein
MIAATAMQIGRRLQQAHMTAVNLVLRQPHERSSVTPAIVRTLAACRGWYQYYRPRGDYSVGLGRVELLRVESGCPEIQIWRTCHAHF